MRLLLLGGHGNFGARIARALAGTPDIGLDVVRARVGRGLGDPPVLALVMVWCGVGW